MPKVCRIGTHLFLWASLTKLMGKGFSYGRRRAVRQWYFDRSPEDLGHQVMKYQRRKVNDQIWSHRDIMRLARPRVKNDDHRAIVHWMMHGWGNDELSSMTSPGLARLAAFERIKRATELDEALKLIVDHRLPRECVPTQWFGHEQANRVWEALAANGMPYTATLRNLGNMTRVGYLRPQSDAAKVVAERLADPALVRRARIHPFNVLVALLTYKAGRGHRGSGVWEPVDSVVDALEAAFRASFGNVPDAGKRWLIGLDVSGSMCFPELMGVAGLTPRAASAAMSVIISETQLSTAMMAFSKEFVPVDIKKGDTLDTVVQKTNNMSFSATDCSLPMTWATKLWKKERRGFDVFVVFTDNDTNCNAVAPSVALQRYRDLTGIDAKLVVQAMTADRFTIADPKDPGMLDLCGLDSAAPRLMTDFAAGLF